jgi:hypothetical protein
MSLSTDSARTDPALDPEVIPYFPPPRRKGRTAAAIILAVLLIAAVAVTAGWWVVVHRIESEVDAFAAKLADDGGHLTVASRARAGFPFHPTLILTKPEIAVPAGRSGALSTSPFSIPWSYSGDAATVSVSLFSPGTINVALSGAGRLRAAPLGQPLDFAVEAGIATAQLARAQGRETVAVRIANLAIAAPDGETIQLDAANLNVARATVPPANERVEAYSAGLQLLGLTLPETRTTPLGRRMGQLLVEAHLLGPLPPSLDTAAFKSWRDAGGTIEITRLLARFGPLTMSAEGTLALDPEMQAMGAGTGRIQGFSQALDALAATQVIRLNDAKAAKSFLALLARPPTPGAEPQLTAPLTIQDKKLFVGPVAVMQMPHIQWPGLAPTAAPAKPDGASPPSTKPAREDDDAPVPAPAPKVLMPEGR